jgi:hypothetical protein
MKAQKNGKPQGSHNIDELFSNALSKLGKQPSPSVWDNIVRQLGPAPVSPGNFIGGISKWFFIGFTGVAITAAVLFYQSRHSTSSRLLRPASGLPGIHDSSVSISKVTRTAPIAAQLLHSGNRISNSPYKRPELPGDPGSNTRPQYNPVKEIKEKPALYSEGNFIQNNGNFENVSELELVAQSSDVGMNNTVAFAPGIQLNSTGVNDTLQLKAIPAADSGIRNETSSNIPAPLPSLENTGSTTKLEFTLELYTEPSYTGQKLGSRTPNSDAYFNYRKENENSFLGINWGLEGRVARKNIFAQSGIRSAVFGSNASYPFSSTTVDTSRSHLEIKLNYQWIFDTTWVWIQDSNILIQVPVLDSSLLIRYDSAWISLSDTSYSKRNDKSQLRYRYVEIPLLVGYRFGKGKLETQFSGGVALGFLSGIKGNIATSDFSSTMPANRQNIPFNRPLLSLLLRIGCTYQLNHNFGIFSRAAFRYTPRPVFGTSYPLYQRYYSAGLQFGIRFRF